MKATHTVLNGLIGACRDDLHAQSTAARVVAGADQRGRLEDSARRRTLFVNELSALIRTEGKTPRDEGSVGETLRGAFRTARSLVIGDNTGDAYAWCELVATKTQESYERALAGILPTEARETIGRQYLEIADDHAELRLRRSGGA
jgi:uncharacterized protein (TIGR02284 family)